MNGEALLTATNPDIANSLTALRRAARIAREIAVRTDTEIAVVRDGLIVRITAAELKEMGIR